MRRRKPAASTQAAAPQPARHRGRPPAAAPAPTQQQQPSTRQRRGAGCRQDAQPIQAPAKPGGKCKRPWDGWPGDGGDCSSGVGDRTTGWRIFCFILFLFRRWPSSQRYQNTNKRAVSSVSGSQEEESGGPCITGSLPSTSLASRQQCVAQEHPSCPFVEPGKGCNTRVPASCRHTPGCHKPQAGFLRFLPHEEGSGECYTSHPDPAVTGQAVTGPRLGPCVPPRCPTVGTSVAPLVPLARSLGAWLALPSPSRWLLRTIRLGYAIQFARHPSKFWGIQFTSVKAVDAPCLVFGNRSPAGEGCDRAGPSSRYEVRVLQPLLHCAQEKRWVATNFGSASFEPCTSQAAIQDFDAETHFRVHPSPRLVCSDRPEGRVLSCLDPPATQAIPAVRVRGSGISVHGSALQAVPHRDLVLRHHSQLGLRVNWEKSKLMPMQRISFLGMELDSVNQTARLTQERTQLVQNCLKTLSGRTAVPLKLFQRLLGHMAAAAAIVPLGLLHMRPLQHWLHGRVPRWAWKHGTHRVQITPACHKTFSLWTDPSFLQAGVPLEQVSRHAVVFTDASTGWGATYNGHAVSGVWTGPQLRWHINCLELLAVRLALSRLRGRFRGKDVLVRTDNMATIAYINQQGGLRSHRMSQLARHLNELSRATLPGEWRFHPQVVQLIWIWSSCSGRPVCISRNHPLPVVLLPIRGNARHGCTGTQLAPGPAQICVSPSEPASTDTVQDQGGQGAGPVSGSILAQKDLVPGTHALRDSLSLADSSEEGSAFSEMGHPLVPASRLVETPCVVPVPLTVRTPGDVRSEPSFPFCNKGWSVGCPPPPLRFMLLLFLLTMAPVEGRLVGKVDGAPSLPSWDLALVLRALQTAPFEPLQSVELKFLSMKTLLLTALASIKRVGDL